MRGIRLQKMCVSDNWISEPKRQTTHKLKECTWQICVLQSEARLSNLSVAFPICSCSEQVDEEFLSEEALCTRIFRPLNATPPVLYTGCFVTNSSKICDTWSIHCYIRQPFLLLINFTHKRFSALTRPSSFPLLTDLMFSLSFHILFKTNIFKCLQQSQQRHNKYHNQCTYWKPKACWRIESKIFFNWTQDRIFCFCWRN
jgi:hypothetical protein